MGRYLVAVQYDLYDRGSLTLLTDPEKPDRPLWFKTHVAALAFVQARFDILEDHTLVYVFCLEDCMRVGDGVAVGPALP